MIELVIEWGHGLAAFLFAALVIWQATMRQAGGARIALTVACAMTALWCVLVTLRGPLGVAAGLGGNLSDLGWIGFMAAIQPPIADDGRRRTVYAIYGIVIAAILLGMLLRLLPFLFVGSPRIQDLIVVAIVALRIVVTMGSLLIAHNLYAAAAPEARWRIGSPMAALAAIWVYDLNLSTVAYLAQKWPEELFALRGFFLALVAPLLVSVSRAAEVDRLPPARSAALRFLPLTAIAIYVAAMVMLARLLNLTHQIDRLGQVTIAIGFSGLALAFFPSSRLRSGVKQGLSRHLFQHHYDYRVEWRQFTDTLGIPGRDDRALGERVVQAIADIPDAPGGLLLLTAQDGALEAASRWNWADLDPPQRAANPSFGHALLGAGTVEVAAPPDALALPDWIADTASAWLVVPLTHYDRLLGAVLLEKPHNPRALDAEDHDLLRLAGRQAASYLAEALGQEALSDARRFDEFNRRFAFIMHDVKNLVSQLSLLARNAERHADNPDFRKDMVATLQSSVGKMNDLLARLSQHHRAKPEEPTPQRLLPLVDRIGSRRDAPVEVSGDEDLVALVDPARLEQALGHLIQNAIDASSAGAVVEVLVGPREGMAAIDVIDHGVGMSIEFVRTRLFHAFASTKEGGFGIGAFEARALIAAMGGRIEVQSREGEGTRFTVLLPIVRKTEAVA
ncbi:XrtA/PEP-CTERM system histidine kinase PrsK [Sphingomonas montanisoli]|uniref:histidine kinase n=1 Tax=Sphingomonas montanisoli TaxID=2606412 RepID=A0A5D9C6M2_9SPHN|nr:XrtA/PEP-CTERM system histidine kinase PrsK [Sphingomonas montanisoli]TZG27498.1 PEP-CTERM system histidine kinase PrsK [Sphingomonas montanisoli]